MDEEKLSEAVRKTINYAEKYKGKLTLFELWQRLISNIGYKKEEVAAFVQKKKIKLVKKEKKDFLKKKITRVQQLSKRHFAGFEDVIMVGITGSVAAGYPKKDDDIDLIIITKKNTLWLTRLKWKLHCLIKKIPERKFETKETENEFCFNLWLDEKALKLPKQKQNLKSAVDLILMKPILNKNKIYERFIYENMWAKKYVAVGYGLKNKKGAWKRKTKDKKEKNFIEKSFLYFLNLVAFLGQYFYMKRKIKNEKVGLHFAFFHRH